MTHRPAPHVFRPSRRRFLAGLGGLLLAAGLGFNPTALEARVNRTRLRDSMQRLYGSSGLAILEEWFSLLDRLQTADLDTQLREVNEFFNRRVRWLEDTQIWGAEDFWATPLETMGKRQGDCEDYSIAKYVTLKELGVPGSRLRMIYVRARIGRSQIVQAHMVLGYYEVPTAVPLILDNLVPSITPATQRTDLDPVFSFNSEGLWAGGSSQSRADPVARLSRWRSVIERMQQQGFI
ncbi:MAG: transglutaminase-like cysteine peptidase [Halomonas sp.]|uniref:Transglutaminase-like cysteine peptidase n=1 Tax=Billgrantia antri TaxID=2846777 RepID=A0ABS6ZPD4_9GAMM|nr:transglutaminase-like cysteine peptidase [Halomonas antri]MBW6391337.1 transglutaminase-like cysteine peptidase [Halomonas antri]MDX5378711.1 transglutaminase-like cysteine peptidase [Halomonas sp.]